MIRGRDWFADAIVGMFDDVEFDVDDDVPTSATERRLFSHDVIEAESGGAKAWIVMSWNVWISRLRGDASR